MENNKRTRKISRRNMLLSSAATGTALAIPLSLSTAETAQAHEHNDYNPSALPTGRQYEIRRKNQSAVITEEGATLRSYKLNGRELLFTFKAEENGKYAMGQVLLPFPNRVEDGKYVFQGNTYQLPINEAWSNNAIHGLVRFHNWDVIEQRRDRIVFGLVTRPQDGYPFVVSYRLEYKLSDKGLEVTTTAKNLGKSDAPYGAGYHPYFQVTDTIDTAILTLPANTYMRTTERLLPTLPPVTVEGTELDFRKPRVIGNVKADTQFGDLIYDKDGYARVTLANPNGKVSVTMFLDSTHKYIQIYTSHTLPTQDLRKGIVIEPYTCSMDAFNNGLGLIVLKPGQSFTNHWGITGKVEH